MTTYPGSTNHNILYYFHGGPGDEHEWNSLTGISDSWQANGLQAPTVVAITFGPKWLLVEKNSSPLSGLYETFTRKVLPYVESHLLANPVSGRQLIGLSMGGFNAAQLLLKTPSLFTKVVLLCPLLLNISPMATPEEIKAARDTWKVKSWDLADVIAVISDIKTVIPDNNAWLKSSPFILGQRNLSPAMPKIYLTFGGNDIFYDGDVEFSRIARHRGAPITEALVNGNHCSGNFAGIAKFLVEP